MINISSYDRPDSIDEALALISAERYLPLAGGTDLIIQLRAGERSRVLDIGRLGMDYITEHDNTIEIGAAATHTAISTSNLAGKYLPLLKIASGLVGSRQIRNRGTVGGNIANASPCADTIPALLNYDTELVLISKGGERRVKLSEFTIKPYETIKRDDELLKCIICNKDNLSAGHSYIKLGRRQAVNISRMSVAVTVTRNDSGLLEDVRIAAGSVFPTASRIPGLESMLIKKSATPKLISEAGEYAAELMIEQSGTRWSTPYKKPVLIGLMIRAINEAVAKAGLNR